MMNHIAPETIPDVLDKARLALPSPLEYAKEEVRVISMTMRPGRKGNLESMVYTATFRKVLENGAAAWELKEVESRPANEPEED